MPGFSVRIGIIGAGKMGEALVRGLLRAGARADMILVADKLSSRKTLMMDEYQVRAVKDNRELIKEAEVVVLAIKPQNMAEVLQEIAEDIRKKKPLVISIAAGISIGFIREWVGDEVKLVRVMPNTPALIGEGISAFYSDSPLAESEREQVQKVLSALGQVVEIEKEELMDAVTGLSGSGPAYIFVLIEALADAGVKMGLAKELALQLSAKTVVGAGKLVLETNRHPAELKDMVTSPAGTTIYGLSVLEEGGLRGLVIKAVERATLRSRELAEEAKAKKERKK